MMAHEDNTALLNLHESPKVDVNNHDLHQLARDGDVEMMKRVLQAFPSSPFRKKKLYSKDGDKLTPFHIAARHHQHNICKLLKDYKIDVDTGGPDETTPLHLVAKYRPKRKKEDDLDDSPETSCPSDNDDESEKHSENNKEVLNFLIESGAQINKVDFYGLTPLHHASLRGNDLCVDRLLQCEDIKIEAKDNQGMTPLHLACKYGNFSVARKLIEANADIHCKDNKDGSPILFASAGGYLKIVKLLFKKCKDPVILLCEKNNDGNTALHLAIHKAQIDVIKFLIEKCIEHYKDGLIAERHNKDTPLHGAAKHGELAIVETLLDSGVDVNIKNDRNQTPLFFAAQYNNYETVKALLDKGANVNILDSANYTPLLIAASKGHIEIIKLLLEKKANMRAMDKNEKSIIYICAEEKRIKALQNLLQNKEARRLLKMADHNNNTPLHVAAINGRVSVVKVLLENGALNLLQEKNMEEQTPIHLAAKKGSVAVAKELIEKNKAIVHDADVNGDTALHLAASNGKNDCIRVLLHAGALTNARNIKQWTPLDCSASAGKEKSALILLKAGAPVNALDKRNQTPLHLACIKGHPNLVQLLLKWGADVTLRCTGGKNALDHAVDTGHADCAMAIVESNEWQDAMKNRNWKNNRTIVVTPMRKIIGKMPEVALEVFKKCMKENNEGKEDLKYKISFNYEFLDDEYSSRNWLEEDQESADKKTDVEFRKAECQPLNCCTFYLNMDSATETKNYKPQVYNHLGEVEASSLPYTRDSTILKENHPLNLMMEHRREDLLRHPLVISLLNHKWRSYGRTFYYFNFFIYFLFMAIFNIHVITIPPPFAVNDSLASSSASVKCAVLQQAWEGECRVITPWQTASGVITILLAVVGLTKEVGQMVSQRLNYLLSFTNFIEVGAYLLSILAVVNVTEFGQVTGIKTDWQWQCAAVAIFLSWMGFLLFLQNFPRFGIYVLMFTNILNSFLSFFIVFAFFILGFAFSFHVLFQNKPSFSYLWNSIFKTFTMMLGELDYEGLFSSEDDPVQYPTVSYILFLLFLIIMSIVIINLLVGLAVDDIQIIHRDAVLEKLIMQVKLTLDIEYAIPRFWRKKYIRKGREFSPNYYKASNWLVQWMHGEQNITQDDIDDVFDEKTNLESMEEKINGLKTLLLDRTKQLEIMIRALAKNSQVSWVDSTDDSDEDESGHKDDPDRENELDHGDHCDN